MSNELVSVITPSYNSEKYISQCIQSVISQTYENWQMIIVDDCSKDNTIDVIQEYCNIDERIKLIKLHENSGAAIARNTAIKLSKGRFIAFLDADDIWDSQKLEIQIEYMLKNNIGFCFSAYEVIDDDGSPLNKVIEVKNKITYWEYLKNTIIQTVTVVIDKKYVKNVEMPNLRRGQDFATWLKIMKEGIDAYGLNINLAKYRRANGSLSSNKIKAVKRTWYIYRKIEKLSILVSLYCFGGYALNACKKRMYKKHIGKSIKDIFIGS